MSNPLRSRPGAPRALALTSLGLLASVLGSARIGAACAPELGHGQGQGQAQGEAPAAARGVFVRSVKQERAEFVPWAGELSVQAALNRLVHDGGGELRFTPGEYEVEAGFELNQARGVSVYGTPGTLLRFAPDPAVRPRLVEDVRVGDTTLVLDDASGIVAGRRYQVYPADLKGDRLLELRVTRVEGATLYLARPVAYMGHVKAIPRGAALIDDVCFFRVTQSDDLRFEGLRLDGLGRGGVHGHTTFCGIYVVGVHRPGELPTSRGLTVRGCELMGLQGRGICVYSMAEVLVEGCSIRDVDSQAIELDHFTSGVVVGNDLRASGVGVALNDAFGSRVEANTIVGCNIGVTFVKHFDQPQFNTGNLVQDNLIIGATGPGVDVPRGITGNTIRGNRFGGQPEARWVRSEAGNTVEGNVALR